MTEQDHIPEGFGIEEVAGQPFNLDEKVRQGQGIPMSENDAYYLHEYVDPMIDRLIANMEIEKERRLKSDEYQSRTNKQIREL